MRDPTLRFSDRVENYRKYRPGYPPDLYELLKAEAGLKPGDRVADLGSGTGLLSQVFLDHGHQVYAVEPNGEMRAAAESLFSTNANFVSLEGRAEAIPLPDRGADFVAAGQAFHWFEPTQTKREIQRILRPGQQVALIWNRRDTQSSPFQAAYERLLERFGTDYLQVDQQRIVTDEKLAAFFAPHPMTLSSLPNRQSFDAVGLRGRLLSSSYTPNPGDPQYEPMLAALEELFEDHQQGGVVLFDYLTTVYSGALH